MRERELSTREKWKSSTHRPISERASKKSGKQVCKVECAGKVSSMRQVNKLPLWDSNTMRVNLLLSLPSVECVHDGRYHRHHSIEMDCTMWSSPNSRQNWKWSIGKVHRGQDRLRVGLRFSWIRIRRNRFKNVQQSLSQHTGVIGLNNDIGPSIRCFYKTKQVKCM